VLFKTPNLSGLRAYISSETPALVLGVLQLVLGGVVSGVLLILTYTKIRDSVNRSRLSV